MNEHHYARIDYRTKDFAGYTKELFLKMQELFKRKGSFSPRAHSWLALVAIGGILYFVVAVAILHVLRPDLNPIRRAVSNYTVGPFGLLMTAAFFTLALSEFALALGFARLLTPSKGSYISVLLLNFAGTGMVMTGIFPGDVKSLHPPGTITSLIHWIGAGLSFLSLMIAAFLLSNCFKTDSQWQSFQRSSFALSVITVLALVVFGIFAMIGWVGIGERLYIAACVLWLLLASMQLRRSISQDDAR
jgi:hypothetical protein